MWFQSSMTMCSDADAAADMVAKDKERGVYTMMFAVAEVMARKMPGDTKPRIRYYVVGKETAIMTWYHRDYDRVDLYEVCENGKLSPYSFDHWHPPTWNDGESDEEGGKDAKGGNDDKGKK